MDITINMITAIMPNAKKIAPKYLKCLNDTMRKYDINTRYRMAYFLATVAVESGEMRYTEEIASGIKYDTGRLAIALGNTPQADGDGQKYKGRGFIQVTGLGNYKAYKQASGFDVVADPTMISRLPLLCCDSAGWFWKRNNLNALADKDMCTEIRKRVNGGLNGFDQYKIYVSRAKKALMPLFNQK